VAQEPSGRLRRAAQIFDEVRAAVPDHRASTYALMERYRAEGLLNEDLIAHLMEQTRSLNQQIRKLRMKTDEIRQAPLNFKETLPDGSVAEYNKAIEDTTPEECAWFIQDQAKVVRREQTKLLRLHEEFKDMHGRKYTRQLKLNIKDFLPPEPETAGA
jgi:uncharacterized coiled-coil protein SlyX